VSSGEGLAGAVRLAREARKHSLRMTSLAGSSHVGSALSCCDILGVLYSTVLNHRPEQPDWPDRDRFIMSKGHAAVALYAVLAESGYFDVSLLDEYGSIGTPFAGHVTAGHIPGVEFSAGSLGHGLPLAVGVALGLRKTLSDAQVFCLMSDGECQEGSVWEAALLARQWRLGNLHVVIDANAQQGLGPVSEIADLEPFGDKWAAFGWRVCEVDGHDPLALTGALHQREHDVPTVTIARTVKGRGVSFMEGRLEWHYRSPSEAELQDSIQELESH
jgi:transketolase